MRLRSTLIRPSGGRAAVLGHVVATDPGAVRARVSVTGQFASVDEDLTAAKT